jgi:predicted HNH restriction endonuclease
VLKAVAFFVKAFQTAIVLGHRPQESSEFPSAPNRSAVRRHLVRERSTLLARLRKEKDGYTCQICGINFRELYGDLGTGFAEAHHRIPLASPQANKSTKLEDLITVCANCHRMLHYHSGRGDNVKHVRKALTRSWPAHTSAP